MSWYRIPDPSLEIPAPPSRQTPRINKTALKEASLAGSLILALAWGLAEIVLIFAT